MTPQSWNLYTYVRNNPPAWTDPDGHKIKIEGKTGDKKKDKEFKKKVKEDLKKAAKSDPRMKQAIKNLKKSENVHTITSRDAQHTTNQNIADDRTKASDGTGTGSTTYYNPDIDQNADGESVPAEVNLAHEMSHAEDADTGTRNPNVDLASNVKTNEIKAVQMENIMRRSISWLPRQTYGGQIVPCAPCTPPNPWPNN